MAGLTAVAPDLLNVHVFSALFSPQGEEKWGRKGFKKKASLRTYWLNNIYIWAEAPKLCKCHIFLSPTFKGQDLYSPAAEEWINVGVDLKSGTFSTVPSMWVFLCPWQLLEFKEHWHHFYHACYLDFLKDYHSTTEWGKLYKKIKEREREENRQPE